MRGVAQQGDFAGVPSRRVRFDERITAVTDDDGGARSVDGREHRRASAYDQCAGGAGCRGEGALAGSRTGSRLHDDRVDTQRFHGVLDAPDITRVRRDDDDGAGCQRCDSERRHRCGQIEGGGDLEAGGHRLPLPGSRQERRNGPYRLERTCERCRCGGCGRRRCQRGRLGFAVARTVLGFGEGATFPGGLRTSFDSLPPDKRSRGLAIAYSGGSLGAVITPWIVIPIALHFGWRTAFLFTGVIGLAWIAVWRMFARPPYLPPPARRPERFHLPDPRERRFWALFSSYALGAFPIAPILYVAPLVLSRVHGLSQADLGKVLWIPPLGWEIGYFFWGWVADRNTAKMARPVKLMTMLMVMGLPVAATPFVQSPAAALAIFFWMMFVASGFIVISLRSAAQAYPADQTALVAGIGAGSWSAVVAVLMPVLGRMVDQGAYGPMFFVVAALPVAGVLGWLALNREGAAEGKAAS